MGEVKQGNRKITETRETMIAVLIAFGIAAWMKVDNQMFFACVGALVGKSAVFNWGNSKEHAANVPKAV